MQELKRIRHIGAVLGLSALLAACGGGGAPVEDGAPEDGAPEDSAGGEDHVVVTLDGQPVDFTETHCGPSPGNEGLPRLFAMFEGGEHAWVELEGESTYQTRDENGIDFLTGAAQGETEVSNAEDDVIMLSFDLDCRG